MKILFVYTDINVRSGELSCNYGIATLSAVLKSHGHQTDLVYIFGKYNPKHLIGKINSFKPDLIAFSSMSAQYSYVNRLLKDINTKNNIFTLCGGIHPTVDPSCLENTNGLDAICIGEGEEAILDLVENLEQDKDITKIKSLRVKRNGKVYKNPARDFIRDLDSIPFADRDLFEYQKIINSNYGRSRFFASRGCPYDCHYCCNHVFNKSQGGKFIRYRSVENIIKEMETVLSKYKVKVVFMEDDTFTLNKKLVYAFCEEYKKRINIPFMMHTYAKVVTKEMFVKLREAGCFRVAIGVESGNPYIRKEILNRKMTNEDIIKAFKIAKETGMVTKSFNIVGLPFETKEQFKDTIALNAQINPNMVVINTFDPYPGTKLYLICKQNKFLTSRGKSKHFIPRRDTVLNLPEFPRKEILKCYRNFAFNVYKKHSLKKALMYRIYYSKYGEILIKILSPVKSWLFSKVEK